MTRTVADTNIVVSAFLWGGTPREILEAARWEAISLFTSAALIAELEEVLSREKFATRITRAGSSVSEWLGDYCALALFVSSRTRHARFPQRKETGRPSSCYVRLELSRRRGFLAYS